MIRNLASQTCSAKPKWNSMTDLKITDPVLLLIESCTTMRELKQIQAYMTRTGLITHLFPASRVLSFCALADSGDINYARLLFAQISQPNTYIWNTMIRGCCKAKSPVLAISFFRRMVRHCVDMDCRSFVFVLKAFERLRSVVAGESIHSLVWKVGFAPHLLVRNGLIHFYAHGGWLDSARKVFDESSVRDVVSWTTMIDGYVKESNSAEAIKLFDSMLLTGCEPNEVTMISLLSLSAQQGDLSLGKSIHEFTENNNVNCGLNMLNAMLDMYVKCGSLITAREIFDKMQTRDVFSWTSMINAYAKCGELDFARKLFNEMPERNVISWNAMIAGYSQNNRPKEALELFRDMLNAGWVPIESTLVSVLSACAQSGCLHRGRWIHEYYVNQKRIQLTIILANALIYMYAKCGSIDAAAQLFSKMPEKNLVSWNSMIVGYAAHGQAQQALILFEQMTSLGYKPDDITFVGLLSACSHGGLVAQGWEYFNDMKRIFALEPKLEHYACMIDVLGRTGLLDEAHALVKKMPMEPDEAVWGALLNAAKMHSNVKLGKLAADRLLCLNPEDSGIYSLLVNICAKKKCWDDVTMVRSMMRERGIKKTPGHSLIEVEGKFHEFLVADASHPESTEIYRVLNEIILMSNLEDDIHDHPFVDERSWER